MASIPCSYPGTQVPSNTIFHHLQGFVACMVKVVATQMARREREHGGAILMVLRLKLRNLGTHSLTFHQIKHSHVTTTYPLGGLEVWCSHVPRNGIFFMDDQLLPCLYNVLSHFSGKTTTRFCCPWDFPGKNTGVGCRALLQGIFLTPGCRQVLYH